MGRVAQVGLSRPEIEAVFSLLSHLPPRHAVTFPPDPNGGLLGRVLEEGDGILAAVARVNGHLHVADRMNGAQGATGRYETIEDALDALRLSFVHWQMGLARTA